MKKRLMFSLLALVVAANVISFNVSASEPDEDFKTKCYSTYDTGGTTSITDCNGCNKVDDVKNERDRTKCSD